MRKMNERVNSGMIVQDGAVDRRLRQRLVHGQSQTHGDNDPQRHRERRVVEGVVERSPEEVIAEQGLIVAQPDPLRLAEPGVLGETDADGIEDGVDQKGKEPDDPRADEEQPQTKVVPLAPCQVCLLYTSPSPRDRG
jgi:hypothetical protein